MTAVDLVRQRLLSLDPVTEITANRIYALHFPQAPTKPAIRLQIISEVEDFHARGPIGMAITRVQVDMVATSKADAEALEAAVDGNGLGSDASGLRGWYGYLGSPATRVDAIFPAGRRESYEPGELRLYTVSRDYLVHWRRE